MRSELSATEVAHFIKSRLCWAELQSNQYLVLWFKASHTFPRSPQHVIVVVHGLGAAGAWVSPVSKDMHASVLVIGKSRTVMG